MQAVATITVGTCYNITLLCLMLQRQSKRSCRRAQNTDSSYEATADEMSFDAEDNTAGDSSDARGNGDALLDSYVATLLNDMDNKMFRSARVQEIDVPEYKYSNQTNQACKQVCMLYYDLCRMVREQLVMLQSIICPSHGYYRTLIGNPMREVEPTGHWKWLKQQ